jgi:hypothetical protein
MQNRYPVPWFQIRTKWSVKQNSIPVQYQIPGPDEKVVLLKN